VANYKVDIGVKVKGEELKKFGQQLKDTQKQVNGVNKFLDTFRKQNIRVNESISNLNGQLRLAKTTLNDATIGTKQAVQATRDYLTALTNTNAALAAQKAAVVSLQNARRSDAFFLAQGARAGRQNRLDETQSQAISTAIARENNIRIQAELANQELLKEVQTRAPRLPAFQERGLERLEDEFKKKKELTTLEENANKSSKRRLNFQEKQNQELERQKKLGIGINKNEKLINASHKDRVKFAERNGKIRRQALIRANNLLLAEKKITEQRAKQNQTTAAGGSGRRIGSTISSAAIGGAFPLLFGQTGSAAIGGGIGGLAGGAIGGQFGFALSIVGTALGSANDKNLKFNQSLAILNSRLSTVSDGSQLVAKDIDSLAKRFRITKEEAFKLLESFNEFDNPRIRKSLAEVFGSDSGAFQGLAGSNRSAKLAKEIFEARKLIGDQQTTQLLQQNLINGAEAVELALIRAKIKARQKDQLEQAKQISIFGRIGAGFRLKTADEVIEKRIKELEKTFAKTEDQTIKDTIEGLKIIREQLGLVNEAQGQFGQSGVLAFNAITDKVKDLQDEMKRLQNPISQVISLSESIARSFEDSFVGIIKGTMSVGDAFRNMLNVIADEFIRNAARMAANQFQQGLLGFFGNMLSPVKPIPQESNMPSNPEGMRSVGVGATANDLNRHIVGPSNPFDLPMKQGPNYNQTRFDFMKADGGPVKGGNSYIVGERGPELFSPGVSGMITPNHALGGSTNVVVNVDASGSSVQSDGDGQQFGEALATAIQLEIIKQKRSGGLLS